MKEDRSIVIRKVLYALQHPNRNFLKSILWKVRQFPLRMKSWLKWGVYPIFFRQEAFFYAHFKALGLLAKADGPINNYESTLIWNYTKNNLQLSEKRQNKAMQIFFAAGFHDDQYEYLLKNLVFFTRNNMELLLPIFDILSELAACDAPLCPVEEQMIMLAMKKFQIENYLKDHHHDPYKILGCSQNDDNATIRKNYRRKLAEFHPDKLESLRLPHQFVKLSAVRFQQVKTAYEIIKKNRNF